ncbi:DUF937 domain-containing protein [bacterium]|nr:DUF937 domain-containing protein [bacterium]
MPGFIDEFMKNYGSETSKQLASTLGIKKNIARQLIPQIAPLILGGLKKQKDEQGGAPRVDHILNKYGSASVLENIGGLFAKKSKDKKADPQLGGLLGKSGVQATDMLTNQFKLDKNIATKIIPMLAPLILGALTQKRDTGGQGSSGIASLLDQDGDGSILDDVGGFLLKNLAGSKSGGAGNLVGSLLGGLFGKKR